MSYPSERDVAEHLDRFAQAVADGREADAERLARAIEVMDSVTSRPPSYRRLTADRLLARAEWAGRPVMHADLRNRR